MLRNFLLVWLMTLPFLPIATAIFTPFVRRVTSKQFKACIFYSALIQLIALILLFGISYHPTDILSQTVFYIYKSGICLFCDIYSEFDNWSHFFYDGGKISIEYKKYKRSQTYFHWKFVGIRSYVVDLTVATILRARIDGYSNSTRRNTSRPHHAHQGNKIQNFT